VFGGNQVIIVRSPLRITLGGGGTDLPSYANIYGAFCLTAAINKYCYVAINRTFRKGINLKYSEYEHVEQVDDIKHPVFREVLKWAKFTTPQVEIVSIADVPSEGAGLGNSGAFAVALIKAVSSYRIFICQTEKLPN
jgi:D-glycero-alpha-D-manno-heptose-7-phosphate kinase